MVKKTHHCLWNFMYSSESFSGSIACRPGPGLYPPETGRQVFVVPYARLKKCVNITRLIFIFAVMPDEMKIAVISGGTKGIGKAVVYEFARNGFNIATCARSNKDLELLAKDFKADFPELSLLTVVCDVAVKKELESFSRKVNDTFGKTDVLVNNAGIFMPGQIHNEEEGVFETQIDINLAGAYHLTRFLLDGMMKQKSGHIFNICSTASIVPYVNGGSYCISKFALLGFTKVLREEMKAHNVRVTAVLPGATFTGSWSGTTLPSSRFMRPEDIASAIYNAYSIGETAVVEEILIRPVEGDI
jgi:short-subunit dehydrogenase